MLKYNHPRLQEVRIYKLCIVLNTSALFLSLSLLNRSPPQDNREEKLEWKQSEEPTETKLVSSADMFLPRNLRLSLTIESDNNPST